MKVLKWVVPVDDEYHPIGWGKVAHVGTQNNVVTVWTVEDFVEPATRPARVFGTGQSIPKDLKHLGTTINGVWVWHLFGGAKN